MLRTSNFLNLLRHVQKKRVNKVQKDKKKFFYLIGYFGVRTKNPKKSCSSENGCVAQTDQPNRKIRPKNAIERF